MAKKIISILLLLVWCGFIFYNSCETGEVSGNKTDKIISEVVSHVSNVKKDSKKMKKIIKVLTFPLRKCAHFFEYFILGLLSMNVLYLFGVNKRIILYSICFCFLYSVSDEVHQLYSDGRSGRVYDVIIDTLGSCLSIYLYNKFIIKRFGYEKKIN